MWTVPTVATDCNCEFPGASQTVAKTSFLVSEELGASSVSPHTAPKCPGWAASRIAGFVLLDPRNLAGCSGLCQEI